IVDRILLNILKLCTSSTAEARTERSDHQTSSGCRYAQVPELRKINGGTHRQAERECRGIVLGLPRIPGMPGHSADGVTCYATQGLHGDMSLQSPRTECEISLH